jgi:hypothetical protein
MRQKLLKGTTTNKRRSISLQVTKTKSLAPIEPKEEGAVYSEGCSAEGPEATEHEIL